MDTAEQDARPLARKKSWGELGKREKVVASKQVGQLMNDGRGERESVKQRLKVAERI